MKVYDKEMYNKQESIKTVIIFIIVFLLGFVAGYYAKNFNDTQKNQDTNSTYVVQDKIDE